MPRKVNARGLRLLKQFEGLRLKAYRDGGGVLTIGYGHTSAAGQPVVHSALVISAQEAEEIFIRDIAIYEKTVEDAVKVKLNDNQFAALVSLCYNIGPGAFRKSTLLKKLNKGDYGSVPRELGRYVYDNGVKIKGLVNRRAAEAGLWAKDSFVSSASVPAAPSKGKAAAEAALPAGAGAAAGATTLPINDIAAVVQGQQDALSSGNWVMIGVAVLLISAGLYIAWRKYKEKSA